MAEIRAGRDPGGERRTPVGWIIGLVVVALVTVAIIWWVQAGAPPAGVTGQEGVEERVEPTQPGLQPTDPAAPGAPTGQPPGGEQPPGGQPPAAAPPPGTP